MPEPQTTKEWREAVEYRLGKSLDEAVSEAAAETAALLDLRTAEGADEVLLLPTGDVLRACWRTEIVSPVNALHELADEVERVAEDGDEDAADAALVLRRAAQVLGSGGRTPRVRKGERPRAARAYLELTAEYLADWPDPEDWRLGVALAAVEARLGAED